MLLLLLLLLMLLLLLLLLLKLEKVLHGVMLLLLFHNYVMRLLLVLLLLADGELKIIGFDHFQTLIGHLNLRRDGVGLGLRRHRFPQNKQQMKEQGSTMLFSGNEIIAPLFRRCALYTARPISGMELEGFNLIAGRQSLG